MLNPSLIAYLNQEPVLTLQMLAEMEEVPYNTAEEAFVSLQPSLTPGQDYILLPRKQRHNIKFIVASPGRMSPASGPLTRRYLRSPEADIYLLTRSGYEVVHDELQSYIDATKDVRTLHKKDRGLCSFASTDNFIYIIQELTTKHIKIGVSHNPSTRIKQMQTGNSNKLHLLDSIPVDDAYKVERKLHHELRQYKVRGEWFLPEAIPLVYGVSKETCAAENTDLTNLQVKFDGVPMLTFSSIDAAHKRPNGTAKRNFMLNKHLFSPAVDYHYVRNLYSYRVKGVKVPNRGIILITYNGYLKLVRRMKDTTSQAVIDHCFSHLDLMSLTSAN